MTTDVFEQARALHHAGKFADAAALYRQVVAQDINHFRAYNNLGACEDELQHWEQAELAFRSALALAPDEAPIQHNLGRLLHKQGKHTDAEHHYCIAIQLNPEFGDVYFNLGRLMQDLHRLKEATVILLKATQLIPDSTRPQAVLGDVFFDLQMLPEALTAYRKVTDITPTDAEAHFHVGKVLETMSLHDEAAESYRCSLAIEGASPATREALARSLTMANRQEAAVQSLQEWLELEPEQPVATHMLAALGSTPIPDGASEEYVRDTFDRFADNFDVTLEKLNYQAPHLVQQMMNRHYKEPAANLHILDVGCGTGLCGPLLRPFAASLTGIDLSAGMLKLAAARKIYDELLEIELVAYLASQKSRFDAIVSADTFCYLGKLDTAFEAAARALKVAGMLIFTVEQSTEQGNYRLGLHGRYAHNETYVRNKLSEAGFDKIDIECHQIRNEGGIPVEGIIVTAVVGTY
jgi:predicted TPR repeat methyltransferase